MIQEKKFYDLTAPDMQDRAQCECGCAQRIDAIENELDSLSEAVIFISYKNGGENRAESYN